MTQKTMHAVLWRSIVLLRSVSQVMQHLLNYAPCSREGAPPYMCESASSPCKAFKPWEECF